MLNLRRIKHVAERVGFTEQRLVEIAENADSLCQELILLDPAKPNVLREVLNVRGDLRRVQERLLRKVFMPRLTPSPYAHGGVRGRHIKSNIQVHADSVFVLTADISNFFPSVSRNRVYRLFAQKLGCTPDVARLLTRLCTYRHHLALGLVTSPFLAEQVLLPIDQRLNGACNKAGLSFTRYVDDITISGPFDLEKSKSGFAASVSKIMSEHGFKMHPGKLEFGRLDEGTPITKITIRRGHPDVRREYLHELHRQLNDANDLARDREFLGPYFTRGQIAGRVRFVCWINPGRRKQLIAKLNSIPWRAAARIAADRGLVAAKRRLVRPQEMANRTV